MKIFNFENNIWFFIVSLCKSLRAFGRTTQSITYYSLTWFLTLRTLFSRFLLTSSSDGLTWDVYILSYLTSLTFVRLDHFLVCNAICVIISQSKYIPISTILYTNIPQCITFDSFCSPEVLASQFILTFLFICETQKSVTWSSQNCNLWANLK